MSAPAGPPRPWRRRVRRAVGALALLVALGVLFALGDGWRAFGRRADGARLARMHASPQWKGGHFVNVQPLVNDMLGAATGAMRMSRFVTPTAPVPTVAVGAGRFATPPPSGLRVTWLGHSTALVEIDGHRVLTDPVWAERASPYDWIGPRRYYTPPLPLAELPPLDAVVISHDHYDHLDHRTITALRDRDTRFIVPLGVGAHLEAWGVPAAHIVELDWWQSTRLGDLDIVCTPARHASGRVVVDRDAKLWSSWTLLGPHHRAFFSGDTGLFPAMKDIGARLGPFDLTMLEVGAYHSAWPDWHMGPEQAVVAHLMLRGRLLLPVHWGLFSLAYHGWTEPIERALAAGAAAGATLAVPRPGESFEPASPPPVVRWWPAVPWTRATDGPIVSSACAACDAPPAAPAPPEPAGPGDRDGGGP